MNAIELNYIKSTTAIQITTRRKIVYKLCKQVTRFRLKIVSTISSNNIHSMSTTFKFYMRM